MDLNCFLSDSAKRSLLTLLFVWLVVLVVLGNIAMAGDEPQSWPRQYYEQGGDNPFLFYVVYGTLPAQAQPSRSRYHVAGIPQGIDLSKHDGNRQGEACSDFLKGYLWETLEKAYPKTASAVKKAPDCIVVRGHPASSQTLDYLRDVVGLITYLLDNGGVAVFDPQMFHWWSPGDWRSTIFEPGGAVPRHHVTILISEEEHDGLSWYHTRGMRKFGRPDLSVHNVPKQHADAVTDLINRFIEMQAFGAVIPEGQEIRMAALPGGMSCHHGGNLDDPDFNNVHVEIRWP